MEKQISMEHSPIRSGLRILRRKTAAERCGVHQATVMRWATEDRYQHLAFPKPVQLADGSVGFLEHELDAWIASRPRTTEANAA